MRKMTKDAGFTLIELLVVVAIIGILAAIAIPQFAEYRARGFDSRSLSDLRNAATGEEAYFADFENYIDCTEDGAGGGGAGTCEALLPAFSPSAGVTLDMVAVAGPPVSFTGGSAHPDGSVDGTADCYLWDSAAGGLTGRSGAACP